MKFYKYHGAGNDFLIADGRGKHLMPGAEDIAEICDRHTGFGADGVMILEDCADADFRMRYYNSDGSGGMMCGNGGRCIVAFAADLGYGSFVFEAPDGRHVAHLLSDAAPFSGQQRSVKLKMKDVAGAVRWPDGWFLDTGTRHFVKFTDDGTVTDVVAEGRRLRNESRFAPAGVNVNFVRADADGSLVVRTYEKGVEDETLACGTGIVASALASWLETSRIGGNLPEKVRVKARISELSVSFTPRFEGEPAPENFRAEDVWLEGPAVYVGEVVTPRF